VNFCDAILNPADAGINYDLLIRYRRKHNDLIYVHTVTLKQAINCEPIKVPTLDGRTLLISIDQIVTPKTVKLIEGEGMPIKNHSH
jgi:DnaJ-class molecular chaperone